MGTAPALNTGRVVLLPNPTTMANDTSGQAWSLSADTLQALAECTYPRLMDNRGVKPESPTGGPAPPGDTSPCKPPPDSNEGPADRPASGVSLETPADVGTWMRWRFEQTLDDNGYQGTERERVMPKGSVPLGTLDCDGPSKVSPIPLFVVHDGGMLFPRGKYLALPDTRGSFKDPDPADVRKAMGKQGGWVLLPGQFEALRMAIHNVNDKYKDDPIDEKEYVRQIRLAYPDIPLPSPTGGPVSTPLPLEDGFVLSVAATSHWPNHYVEGQGVFTPEGLTLDPPPRPVLPTVKRKDFEFEYNSGKVRLNDRNANYCTYSSYPNPTPCCCCNDRMMNAAEIAAAEEAAR